MTLIVIEGLSRMDFKGLEYFVMVVENGGYTQAAEKEFVAQPAISRKIAQLEQELDVTLFLRGGRRNKLTSKGKIVYRWAKRILLDKENLMRDLKSDERPLRIVYFSNGSIVYVSRVVRKLQEAYPDIQIYTQSIRALPAPDASFASGLDQLEHDKVDVLVTFLPNVKQPGMEWIKYRTIEAGGLCAIAGEGHPLFGKNGVTTEALRKYPLVFPNPRFTPYVANAMRRVLHEPAEVIDSTDFTDFCVQIIANGYVGVMPYSSRTVSNNSLCGMPVLDIKEGFDLVAVWKKECQHPDIPKLEAIL